MAFSVQVAAELTSAAAPRTVLHAAIVSAPPMKSAVRSLRVMISPPLSTRNDHDGSCGFLSSALTVAPSAHRVFGAVRDRVHVPGSAADGIARRKSQGGSDQHDGGHFLEHCRSSPHLSGEPTLRFRNGSI